MNSAVLLTGGPTHPFAETAPLLVDLLCTAGFATTVVTEPADAVAALRQPGGDVGGGNVEGDGAEGDAVDLLVVHALRWRMTQDRYADQRAEHAVALTADDLAVLDRHVRGGGGLLALHTAVICFDADPTWHALCGASWQWDRSTHPPLGSVDVDVTEAGTTHELTRGIGAFTIEDEAYGFLDELDGLEPLLVADHGGRTHPLLWARAVGAGRVVTDLLGHGPASLRHPAHRAVLQRAITWAARRPAPATPAATAAPAVATRRQP